MNLLRRNFFKGFGILGAAAAGVAAVKVTIEEVKKPTEDISHLAPEPNTTLTLAGDNRSPEEKQAFMPSAGNGFAFHSNPQITNQVALAVGKDNRLWIKVNDQWKRVSIDA